jgi:hypothetical protein
MRHLRKRGTGIRPERLDAPNISGESFCDILICDFYAAMAKPRLSDFLARSVDGGVRKDGGTSGRRRRVGIYSLKTSGRINTLLVGSGVNY